MTDAGAARPIRSGLADRSASWREGSAGDGLPIDRCSPGGFVHDCEDDRGW
jgi:hypothetical protein